MDTDSDSDSDKEYFDEYFDDETKDGFVIHHDERAGIRSQNAAMLFNECIDSRLTVLEDLESCLFPDFDSEWYMYDTRDIATEKSFEPHAQLTEDDLMRRYDARGHGRLPRCSYDSAFKDATVKDDDAESFLEKRYLLEKNTLLDHVIDDVK